VQAPAPIETRTREAIPRADLLFHYACGRLDPGSLRCWIIQRLMLDEHLDHEHAEDAYARVIAAERALVARQELTPWVEAWDLIARAVTDPGVRAADEAPTGEVVS
jgi:hypothetical protein